MQAADDKQIHWFVLGTLSVNREVRIRDDMRHAGIECYVPMKYEVKRVRQRTQRTLIPAIRGLIFAKASLDTLKAYTEDSRDRLYVRKSTFSRGQEYLIVPTAEMENFIRATEHSQENVTYFNPTEIDLRVGDKIVVKGGLYDGIEGVLIRIKGKRKKQLVVSIPDVAIAAVEIEPYMIELKGHKAQDDRDDHKTKNLEKDKKLLFDTAYRLLFVIPDKYQNENEYFLALNELKRIRKRVAPYKGFTPATEGELALAMYLAAVKTGEEVEQATERMRNAIAKLSDSSMLKLRMRFYLAKLSGDEATLAEIMETVKGWKRRSKRQEEILDELKIEN